MMKIKNPYKFNDQRTAKEKLENDFVVCARDTFLSGWGQAESTLSFAGWACKKKDIDKVHAWVKNRSDMVNVKIVDTNYRPGRGLYTIYGVSESHPSIQ